MTTPSLSMVNGVLEYLFPLRAIISNAAATLIAPPPAHAVVSNAAAKPTATLYPLHAVVPNATAKLMAAPSEDDGELDGDAHSGELVTIK
jgi:hypothetical protein